MKITRALLLSSLNQAEAWEVSQVFVFKTFHYRYMVTDHCASGDGLVFEIYHVTQETYLDDRKQERTRHKVAEQAHVHQEFSDAGELINFLRRHQIDFESIWHPMEVSSDNRT